MSDDCKQDEAALPPVAGSESLGWDATEKIYGGIWEMTTPSGRVFRMDLHATHGLGFQAMRRIHIEFTNDHKAAWDIARKCVFRKVDSLHGPPQNADVEARDQ